MDIIKLIELSNTPKNKKLLEAKIKKNIPKVKKIANALLYDLPITLMKGKEEIRVTHILEAEPILTNLLRLHEEQGIVLYKIKK